MEIPPSKLYFKNHIMSTNKNNPSLQVKFICRLESYKKIKETKMSVTEYAKMPCSIMKVKGVSKNTNNNNNKIRRD